MPEAADVHKGDGGAAVDRPGAWARLTESRTVVGALLFLGFLALAAIVLPPFFPAVVKAPSADTYLPPLSGASGTGGAPGWTYLMGTDVNGHDLFYRVLAGARVSLFVGIAGAAVSLFIGTAYGLIAGALGGRVDAVMMRLVDVVYSVPRVLFVMVFIAAFGGRFEGMFDNVRQWAGEADIGWLEGAAGAAMPYSRILVLVLSLGLVEWLTMARIVRGQVLVLRELPYVKASRALGQGRWRIMWMHLLPNVSTVVLTYLTLTVPTVVLDESFLSFLGLGIDDPAASWGSLLREGASAINPVHSRWWLLAFPAALMSLTLLAFNFLGDGLRDAFDPKGAAGRGEG